jgi:hypothetical protein
MLSLKHFDFLQMQIDQRIPGSVAAIINSI